MITSFETVVVRGYYFNQMTCVLVCLWTVYIACNVSWKLTLKEIRYNLRMLIEVWNVTISTKG